MTYVVGSGSGTFQAEIQADPYASYYDADGVVIKYPFGYDPEEDPPPDEVYVTDLDVHDHSIGAIITEFDAYEFLGIFDGGWEGEGERVFRPGQVTSRATTNGWTVISLTDPSTITTHRKARIRFRVSTSLARDLEYQDISMQRHEYTRSLLLGYGYYMTEEQEATGWLPANPAQAYEHASVGGSVGDDEWSIRFEGNGGATLINGSETDIFEIEADTWYVLDYDGTGGTARFTLHLSAGGGLGEQVATTERSRGDPGAPGSVSLSSTSYLWAGSMEVDFDWIRVWTEEAVVPLHQAHAGGFYGPVMVS